MINIDTYTDRYHYGNRISARKNEYYDITCGAPTLFDYNIHKQVTSYYIAPLLSASS